MPRETRIAARSASSVGYSSWPPFGGYAEGFHTQRLPSYSEATMRFFTQPPRFYAGIDLHARTLHLCVLVHDGDVVFDRNLPARPDALLHALAPFRDGLVVGAECMFAWYWVADLCREQGIPFVLGHALYMKAIHGGKAKNHR